MHKKAPVKGLDCLPVNLGGKTGRISGERPRRHLGAPDIVVNGEINNYGKHSNMQKKQVKPADYLFWAVKQPIENPLRKLLLIVLANRADKHGRSYASHSTLAVDCGCSTRAIQNPQTELEKAGLITVERRFKDGIKTSNLYTVNLANDVGNVVPIVGNEVPNRTERGSVPVGNEVPIKHPVLNTQLNTHINPIVPFDIFYSAYPKRVGRQSAQKAWNKLNPNEALINRIMKDIVDRVDQGMWDTGKGLQYIPGPAPYLNQCRWEDAIIPDPNKAITPEQRAAKTTQMLKEMDEEKSWIQ